MVGKLFRLLLRAHRFKRERKLGKRAERKKRREEGGRKRRTAAFSTFPISTAPGKEKKGSEINARGGKRKIRNYRNRVNFY